MSKEERQNQGDKIMKLEVYQLSNAYLLFVPKHDNLMTN